MPYFAKENSIYQYTKDDVLAVVDAITARYIGQNPKMPFVFRGSFGKLFERGKDFKYFLEFNSKFPNTPNEYVVYSHSSLWSDKNQKINLAIECFSPNEVYVNDIRVFKSVNKEEVRVIASTTFSFEAKAGWNDFLIKTKKTNSGFGCRIGTSAMKSAPYHFVLQHAVYEGREGFIYTSPTLEPFESFEQFTWLPRAEFTEKELQRGQFECLYGKGNSDTYAVSWSKIRYDNLGKSTQLSGSHFGEIIIYLNGRMIYASKEGKDFSIVFNAEKREDDLVIQAYGNASGWGYILDVSSDYKIISPIVTQGIRNDSYYVGPFEKSGFDVELFMSTTKVYETKNGKGYWRALQPHTYIRPFYETKSYFGRWNYPLGVTLYGFLKASRQFDNKYLFDYVKDHIKLCINYYEYSVWDRREYGAPGMNYQISGIDSLDDCGSFGSVTLELNKIIKDDLVKSLAESIANHISNKQARLPDGALYRNNEWNPGMNQTMWADDLYMSVPFLIRYYQYTKDTTYLEDAAKQFLLFKKYLFVEKTKLMSHIYNFNVKAPTEIYWGRGNGWVIFSLSELLAVLPEDHHLRADLLNLFKTLAGSYLKLQGTNGMWHQILDDYESYEETSCTSMFIYAFSRGVRFGWLEEKSKFMQSAMKAWNALTRIAIDKYGNVYGICKGSGYSYSSDYYKNELSWLLNDAHGTGIVVLAATEIYQLINQ